MVMPFELTFLVMDPGYRPENRRQIIYNAERLEIPITIFESNIFDVTAVVKNPAIFAPGCAGKVFTARPWSWAAIKLLGHHFNDVIETTLMGYSLWVPDSGNDAQASQQELSRNGTDSPSLLRHEDAIIAWRNYNHLNSSMCLPADRGTNTGSGWQQHFQAAGDERADSPVEAGQSKCGEKYFSGNSWRTAGIRW